MRGATPQPNNIIIPKWTFQPTRPLRGATGRGADIVLGAGISTHAPLAGRDARPRPGCLAWLPISTHAPLAGRDEILMDFSKEAPDISTHAPLAGRDPADAYATKEDYISTHAPLAGRDFFLLTG